MINEELIKPNGNYHPKKIVYKPIFVWPPQPIALLKWLVHFPDGFLWPWASIHIIIGLISYLYFSPSIEQSKNLNISWISIIVVRNFVILLLYTGLWHYWLYIRNSQGSDFKYNPRSFGKGKKWFLGNQVKENMFFSLFSAVPIWSAWEVLMWWCYSNGFVLFPIYEYSNHFPELIYFTCILFLLVPIWQHFHFYWTHRLTHWKPIYDTIHHFHHKNVNVGPWSGLSMHPVEHIIYFSTVVLFFIIPCHPILFIYQLLHNALGAQKGHTGFERLVIDKNTKSTIPSAGYFHYLHHRFFECNYGDITSPLDKWFGSFHDGTVNSHEKIFKINKK